MKNYNKKQQEDLLIEIINENAGQPNLNYSSLRAKINIETKEIKKLKIFANYKSKLIFTCSLVLTVIILFIGINTINKYSAFFENTTLSNVLLNENTLSDNRSNSYEGTGIFGLLINKDETDFYLVEAELVNNKSDYYSAYLNKSTINKVNKYFEENDILNNIEYRDFEKLMRYRGVNDLFVKYSYYLKVKGIKDDNIKWVKYSTKSDVKEVVGKYHLLLTITIQNFKNILDLTTKEKLSSSLTVITEIDLSNNENQLLEIGRYLINVKDKPINDIYISSNYLSWNSALIKTFNEIDYLEGIIPLWYNIYLSDSKNVDWNLKQVVDLKNVLDLIEVYKVFEQKEYIESKDKTVYKYYYDYINMQSLFGF